MAVSYTHLDVYKRQHVDTAQINLHLLCYILASQEHWAPQTQINLYLQPVYTKLYWYNTYTKNRNSSQMLFFNQTICAPLLFSVV